MEKKDQLSAAEETTLQAFYEHLAQTKKASTATIYKALVKRVLLHRIDQTEALSVTVDRAYGGKSSFANVICAVTAFQSFAQAISNGGAEIVTAMNGRTSVTLEEMVSFIHLAVASKQVVAGYPKVILWCLYTMVNEFWPKSALEPFSLKKRTIMLEDALEAPWSTVYGPGDNGAYMFNGQNGQTIWQYRTGPLLHLRAEAANYTANVLWAWGGWRVEDIANGAILFPETPRSKIPMDAKRLRQLLRTESINTNAMPPIDFDILQRRGPNAHPLPVQYPPKVMTSSEMLAKREKTIWDR